MTTVQRTHTTKRTERPIRVGGLAAKFRQWAVIKHEVAELTKRQNQLRDEMAKTLTAEGAVDDKGSYFLDLPEPVEVNGQIFRQIKRERRAPQVFLESAAEELLSSLGLLEEAQTTYTVLDQDKVYVLNQEGKLTDDQIDSLFETRESFAFKPIAD